MVNHARKGISILIASLLIVGIVIAAGVVFFASPKLSGFMLSDYPSALISGEPFSVTVTALDQYGKPYTSTIDPVYLQSSDSNAVIPQPGTSTNPYTFTSADNGVHTFNGFSLISVESSTITVTDGKKTETSNPITVNAAPILGHFEFDPINSPVTVGENFDIKITAMDQYSNVLASYSGTPTLTYSEGSIDPTTITSWSKGVGTATVKIYTFGNGVTITVNEASASGTSNSFDVTTSNSPSFIIDAPLYARVDVPFPVTVIPILKHALDVEYGYTGTIHFTSDVKSDLLPDDYTFVTDDYGIHTFTVTLNISKTSTITVNDVLTPSRMGSVTRVIHGVPPSFVGFGSCEAKHGYGADHYLTPTYPLGLHADDLILLQVVGDSNYQPSPPNDFTLLYGPDQVGIVSQWIFYRFADGMESGQKILVNYYAHCSKSARMWAFRNVVLTDFYEDESLNSGTSLKILVPSVTTTDIDHLAIAFAFMGTQSSGSLGFEPTGAPPQVSWEEFLHYGETGGHWRVPRDPNLGWARECIFDGTYNLGGINLWSEMLTASMDNPRTKTSISYNMTTSGSWGVRAFALIPSRPKRVGN